MFSELAMKSKAVALSIAGICITTITWGYSLSPKPSYGMVVRASLHEGSSEKVGVLAVTPTGAQLFAFALLQSKMFGNSSYGGAAVPEWVQVTWRKDTTPGEYWTTGTVIGDYKIPIANRIPKEVLTYASQGKGRAIRLIFRIKDDGVDLAWDVQEQYGGLSAYSLHGGDFPCDPVSPHASRPTCTSGYLQDASWYRS